MGKKMVMRLGLVVLVMGLISFTISAKGGCNWWTKDDKDTPTGSSGSLPAQVTLSNPVDGATDILITQQLYWSVATGATSYNVYFGTSNPPPFKTNTSGTSYDPGTLTYSITYYWRIDSNNNAGTTIGVIWSFQTPTPPTQATSPDPANGATDVPVTSPLTWDTASRATSYDVYFDTNNPPTTFTVNTTNTSYDPPGTLNYSTTYYWRINAKNEAGTTTGNVWNFQTEDEPVTAPAQVTSPNPANGATGLSIAQQLGWAAASRATSYDVYFDTNNPPTTFKSNTTNTTYNPGTLTYSTTYYWRIDSKNSAFTTTGNVWSFQTLTPPAQVTSPNPSNGATGVSITTSLSWGSAARATSYDVYFGTSTPPTTKVTTTTGRTYNPGTLSSGTTYYWRIDSKNSAGTTTGNVWSFTTILVLTIDSAGTVGYDTSIAIDSNNKVHISYHCTDQGLKYATNASGAWVCTTLSVGSYTSIALDSNNKVHISYLHAGYYDLRYATNASGAWVYSPVDSAGNVGMYSSIAIDSNNKVHISYQYTGQGYLKYATNASGAWVCTTLDSNGYMGGYTSIALDSNNKVHISYYYVNTPDDDLKYATNSSGAWVCTTLDSDGNIAAYTSIAIDSNNKVHIGYYGGYGDLKYATNASGAWVYSTLDSGGDLGRYTSLALDSNNKVHISYCDFSNYDLKYATNASGAWVCTTLDSAGHVGAYTSIAIDSNNKFHISYYDATNGDLKYATNK